MKKSNYFKTPMKYYFVSFYFFILIFIIFFFIKNLVLSEKIITTGVLFDVVPKNYIFSQYNGFIEKIYVEEEEIINEGDHIAKIKILDPEKFEREQKIEYLKQKLKLENEKKEDIIKELEILNNIKNYRIIKSNYSGEIDIIFFKEHTPINFNDNILKFKNKNNFFYIEAFLTPEQIYGLEKNNVVYFSTKNKKIKYKGYIHKISDNLYSIDNILSKGKKLKKPSYKVNIRILEQDKKFIEGMKVDVEIIQNTINLQSWFRF